MKVLHAKHFDVCTNLTDDREMGEYFVFLLVNICLFFSYLFIYLFSKLQIFQNLTYFRTGSNKYYINLVVKIKFCQFC